jgi:DnaK suppressor protein
MEVKARSKRISDLKAYLEEERARLTKELARDGEELYNDEDRAGLGNHMADDATEVFEQAKSVGMHHAQERMLADVEDALARMEDGTYGVCRRCGNPIDSARLRALPTAALCLSCQEEVELRQ